MAKSDDNPLGSYLKNRRARLDPAAFGISSTRRRTPGLRREEVALRANVSATWYTWLEQGRGGTPSADVLDGIANALALTAAEREHLFLLAQHRPPEIHHQASEPVSPQLQRVIDALPLSPAIVVTTDWDIVAWNRAALAVLIDYEAIPPEERNVLRILFNNPDVRTKLVDWESYVRFTVAAFRAETARTGLSERTEALINDLMGSSPEFAAIWRDHDVKTHGEGVKQMVNSSGEVVSFEYSTFTVNGRRDLGVIILTPATPKDEEWVRTLIESRV